MKVKDFNTKVYSEKQDKVDWDTIQRIKLAIKTIGKNKNVLDIGCYDGFITEKIRKYGNKITGLEVSKQGVKWCKARKIKVIEQDLESKFPFKDNTFDTVFGGEIIEHIFDTDSLLQEIKRVLKPNGSLVLTTPNIAALTRRLKLLLGLNPLMDIGLISPQGEKSAGHIRYFTKNSLNQLLKRNGFLLTNYKTEFILLSRFRFTNLAKIFPTLGWTHICKFKNKKRN
jgi:2-polyprenyl-3-methyl-5-hydroxy-6-metoxy-1,4-benzoquinol methylase